MATESLIKLPFIAGICMAAALAVSGPLGCQHSPEKQPIDLPQQADPPRTIGIEGYKPLVQLSYASEIEGVWRIYRCNPGRFGDRDSIQKYKGASVEITSDSIISPFDTCYGPLYKALPCIDATQITIGFKEYFKTIFEQKMPDDFEMDWFDASCYYYITTPRRQLDGALKPDTIFSNTYYRPSAIYIFIVSPGKLIYYASEGWFFLERE